MLSGFSLRRRKLNDAQSNKIREKIWTRYAMLGRKSFVAFVTAVYLLLSILFFVLIDQKANHDAATYEDNCVTAHYVCMALHISILRKELICVYFTVIVAGILSTVLAAIVYVFAKSLKTLAGRCEFMMLIGLSILQAVQLLPIQESRGLLLLHILALVFAVTMASLWTFVLIFDSWSTIR